MKKTRTSLFQTALSVPAACTLSTPVSFATPNHLQASSAASRTSLARTSVFEYLRQALDLPENLPGGASTFENQGQAVLDASLIENKSPAAVAAKLGILGTSLWALHLYAWEKNYFDESMRDYFGQYPQERQNVWSPMRWLDDRAYFGVLARALQDQNARTFH